MEALDERLFASGRSSGSSRMTTETTGDIMNVSDYVSVDGHEVIPVDY